MNDPQTKQSKLLHKKLLEVLTYNKETGIFVNRIKRSNGSMIGKEVGSLAHTGYITISIDGIGYRAHRLAWFYVHKKWPRDEIDHINRVRNDNRIVNLREATRSVNALNIKKKAKKRSGIEGIIWHCRWNCWQINYNGKYLGYTSTVEEGLRFQKEESLGIFTKIKNSRRSGQSEKQSGVVGIYWDKARGHWQIRHNRKYVGYRKTLKEAVLLKESI